MNKSTTDTPRTDEQVWTTNFDHKQCDVVDMEFAKQLELELAHSLANQVKAQDEVERLNEQLTHFDNIHCNCVPKLKAEVERLKGLLSDLLILTEKNYWNSNNYKMIKAAHR